MQNTPTILDEILNTKRLELLRAKAFTSCVELECQAAARHDFRNLTDRLARPGVQIIAEIKRASPSCGDIRTNLDVAATAYSYAAGDAAALSVLTEPHYFKGSKADLQQARQVVSLPILRKDFIIDPYQVYESVVMGADAILLIVRILDDQQLHTLYQLALQLGLDVVIEIFDEHDAQRALALGAKLIGINNRNLADFTTDSNHAHQLAKLLRPETITIAFSGLHSSADIINLLRHDIRHFLIGTALVRQTDPTATLQEWAKLTAAT